LNPARIGDVAAGFDGELAHKAKHGETASEMKDKTLPSPPCLGRGN